MVRVIESGCKVTTFTANSVYPEHGNCYPVFRQEITRLTDWDSIRLKVWYSPLLDRVNDYSRRSGKACGLAVHVLMSWCEQSYDKFVNELLADWTVGFNSL